MLLVLAGEDADPALECFAEGSFGGVAGHGDDFFEGLFVCVEQVGGTLDAPALDVVEWGFSYDGGEAFGEGGAREVGLLGKIGDCPGGGRVGVNGLESCGDGWVGQAT